MLTSSPELAALAQVIASEARASMLLAMLDGRAWTLSELASVAGIAPPTASEHVNRLTDANLVSEVRQGRHRYVRIESVAVAETIEALAAFSGRVKPAPSTLRAQRADQAIRAGRSCYLHLAGRLGVQLCDGTRREGLITDDWQLTDAGRQWLHDLQVRLPARTRRALLRPCLDWTERRDHLAGVVADGLFATFCDLGWLRRLEHSRAVQLTDPGRAQLSWLLGPDDT